MKTIKQATVTLSALALLFAANSGLEARDQRWNQRTDEVIAIQIDRTDAKEKQNVAVEDRNNQHVPVQERTDIPVAVPAQVEQHVQVQERPDQHVQVQTHPDQHVQVQTRPDQHVQVPLNHVQVQERDDSHLCTHCNHPYPYRSKPRYHGRVPVGHGYVQPYYGQGVVVYPYSRVPEPVIVHHYAPLPPCRCHHPEFSMNWGFTFGR